MDVETEVARHYAREGLEARILTALRTAGKDPDAIGAEDLAPVDEFHLGWRPQTVAFAEALGLRQGMTLVDIGAGLGGPARYFAENRGCLVTGIDLTAEFVETARALSARVGLGAVRFETGSGLAMPFADASFDAATLIHVGMNIADKPRLFAEARRVLRPGGIFGIYDVMRMGPGEIPMPMPWADGAETSFVETPESYAQMLRAAGFRPEVPRNRSGFVSELMAQARARIAREGDPVLGLHLVVGPTARERVGRLMGAVAEGLLAPVEIRCEAV